MKCEVIDEKKGNDYVQISSNKVDWCCRSNPQKSAL